MSVEPKWAPRLITLEGPEGAGKTLQSERLAARIAALGREIVRTREPGGTPAAEALRAIALDARLRPNAELFVFLAARADHVETLVRPALERGAVVVCDRFIDSSVAYQGWGLGLGADCVRSLNLVATGGLMPDRTILLDLSPEVGFARRGGVRADGIERRGDEFHRRLREGFLEEARRFPGRIVVIDAAQSADCVAEAIWAAIEPIL